VGDLTIISWTGQQPPPPIIFPNALLQTGPKVLDMGMTRC